jgi:transcriptional regulator with XRE-family HTH domain
MKNASRSDTEVLILVGRLARTDRLRSLRERLGLTQSDVARHIGVDPSNVSRWEAGLARPRPRHAAALLALLEEAS